MAGTKGRRSPAEADEQAGTMDVPTMIRAAFQAGQQSAGSSVQAMTTDSDIKCWLDRFAALLEPLGNLSQPQGALKAGAAETLDAIHFSLARLDLASARPNQFAAPNYRGTPASKGAAS